jgi:anti-repressor protein
MNKIQLFTNPEFGQVRTLTINDEPYFVGKDVTEILGYQNASKALADHVDDEDKLNNVSLSSLGQRGGWLINESGLYSLILSSKLPTAKKFKHWVTSEILPAVRKHGAYMTPETIEKTLNDPDFIIGLATKLKEEQERSRALAADNLRMKPKEIFADAVSVSEDAILIGALAKILKGNGVDIGQKRLFKWMRDEGYLIKNGRDVNAPTQRSMNLGLFKVKERTINNPDGSTRLTRTTLVTGKGQLYFVNKFLQQATN